MEQTAQGERVKGDVEQLLIAFQFQDRVHQIMDQLRHSMTAAVHTLQGELRQGRVPDAQAWSQLLGSQNTLMPNLMNPYLEQSKAMFDRFQDQLKKGELFPGFPPAGGSK